MIYKILAVIEHKQNKLIKDNYLNYENASEIFDKLQLELDNYNNIIDFLYYKFQEIVSIRQVLEFVKANNLNKWLVIKYFDSRYKRQFKVNKFFTKQYLKLKSGV